MNLPVYTTLENWFQEWRKFYIDLFNGQPVDFIVLSLNRMMKKSQQGSYDFLMNQKLFRRMATLLKFKYDEIQNLLPAKATNFSMLANQVDKISLEEGGLFFLNVIQVQLNSQIFNSKTESSNYCCFTIHEKEHLFRRLY